MHDATRPPLEKNVYDRATGKIVTVVRDDPSSAVKFTTEVEKEFFERMDKQLAKKEQRLKVRGVSGIWVVVWCGLVWYGVSCRGVVWHHCLVV